MMLADFQYRSLPQTSLNTKFICLQGTFSNEGVEVVLIALVITA